MLNVSIIPIPTDRLGAALPSVTPFIEGALDHGRDEFTLQEVIDQLQSGALTLWVALSDERPMGAMVTRLISYQRHSVLKIEYLGGERLEEWWPELDRVVVETARQCGCAEVQECGRRGWLRLLPRADYEEAYVVMAKRIDR